MKLRIRTYKLQLFNNTAGRKLTLELFAVDMVNDQKMYASVVKPDVKVYLKEGTVETCVLLLVEGGLKEIINTDVKTTGGS